MKSYLKHEKIYKAIIFYITVLCSVWSMFNWYKQSVDVMKKTQQMALKSVIWNENIPKLERAAACDDYLGLGYNSYTKEYCNSLIKEGK